MSTSDLEHYSDLDVDDEPYDEDDYRSAIAQHDARFAERDLDVAETDLTPYSDTDMLEYLRESYNA